eukprot:s1169_g4.t1
MSRASLRPRVSHSRRKWYSARQRIKDTLAIPPCSQISIKSIKPSCKERERGEGGGFLEGSVGSLVLDCFYLAAGDERIHLSLRLSFQLPSKKIFFEIEMCHVFLLGLRSATGQPMANY